MKNIGLTHIRSHPDYDSTIDEVVNNETDEKLMAEALLRSSREDKAEVLYVLLKLNATEYIS